MNVAVRFVIALAIVGAFCATLALSLWLLIGGPLLVHVIVGAVVAGELVRRVARRIA